MDHREKCSVKTTTLRAIRDDLASVEKWIEAGETVCIVSEGKPYARIVPESARHGFFGATPTAEPLPADLDSPPPVKWEVNE